MPQDRRVLPWDSRAECPAERTGFTVQGLKAPGDQRVAFCVITWVRKHSPSSGGTWRQRPMKLPRGQTDIMMPAKLEQSLEDRVVAEAGPAEVGLSRPPPTPPFPGT